ncbi:unnamed protein product, partial [Allacma fusca]
MSMNYWLRQYEYLYFPQDQFYPELNEHYDIFRRVNSVTVRDGGIVPVLFAPEDARLERPWTDDVPTTSNQPAPVPYEDTVSPENTIENPPVENPPVEASTVIDYNHGIDSTNEELSLEDAFAFLEELDLVELDQITNVQ